MNICIIGFGIHPPWNEGMAIIVKELANALRTYANVFMISGIDYLRNPSSQKLKSDGKTTYLQTNIFKGPRSRGTYCFADKMFDAIRIYNILKSLDSKYGIDVVHICNASHLITSTSTKVLLRRATVAHVFEVSSPLGDLLSESFVDAYISTSTMGFFYLARSLSRKKVHMIPPIIDCNVYKPIIKGPIKSKPLIITYLGNIYPERLPPELIKEIKQSTKERDALELHVYCPDTLWNRKNASKLRASLRKYNIKNRILVSNLTESQKVDLYNFSNILIFPYTTEVACDYRFPLKNFSRAPLIIDPPLAILEGMACGKIVVASRVMSIPDIIKSEENGFLVEPGDLKGIANTLNYVMDNFQNLRHIEVNARRTIEQSFSSDVVVKKVMDIYNSILTKS